MRSFLLILLSFFSFQAFAKVKIAVIDTGYGAINNPYINSKFCESGHFDATRLFFKQLSIPPADLEPSRHGTNVASLIVNNLVKAEEGAYCLMILKFFSPYAATNLASIESIKYAVEKGADIINYSAGGES